MLKTFAFIYEMIHSIVESSTRRNTFIFTMSKISIGLCFVVYFVSVHAQQHEGDNCVLPNNDPGQCKILKDCPKALEDLRNKIFPQICGFQQTVPIVCCKQNAQPVKKPGELSFEKCRKYAELTLLEVNIPTFGIGDTSVNETTCTHIVSPLVIGGVDAEPREFPHMALLGYQINARSPKKWLCGGALISERFVLTAAHCLTSPNDGDVRFIRLGDLNIYTNDDDADPEEFNVVERIRHPEYKLPSKYNDIMLLKMDRQVVFSQFKRPACLHSLQSKKVRQDQRYIATGWGLTEVGATVGSSHLQKVVLDSFSQTECNNTYESNINRKLKDGIRPESQLCAGGKTEEKDTCQGDSGGPLQIYSDFHCMYDIVGVTSFGKSCGLVSVPGVYTNVIHYLDWIEKTVWP